MAVEMKSCLILGSAPVEDASYVREFLEEAPYVICADGGLDLARRCGIRPDLIVGDSDPSQASLPADVECVRLPVMKDDTDTMAAVKIALERGYESITLAGVLGGRLDHTFANIQAMAWAAGQGASLWMADRQNEATVLMPGIHRILKRDGYKLSLFGIGEGAFGITLKGLQYPLTDATLTMTTPLGVSNEWKDEIAQIELKKGMLLLILSKD